MDIFSWIIDQFIQKQRSSEYWITFGRESDLTKGYPKAVCYFYQVMLVNILNALDIVYSKEYPVVNVDSYFAEEYEKYIPVMINIQRRKDLPYPIPKTELHAFRSLHADIEVFKPSWPKIKDIWLDDLKQLSEFFGEPNIKAPRYPLPLDLEKSTNSLRKYAKQHRQKQIAMQKKLTTYTWKNGTLKRKDKAIQFNTKLKPYKAINLLLENKGDLVTIKQLCTELECEDNHVTRVIHSLRKRLTEHGMSQYFKITSAGDGGYTIIVS